MNNWPMYIIGGAAAIFLLIMIMVASDRANQQHEPEDKKKEKTGNSSLFANQISGMDSDGIIPSKAEPPVVPALNNAPVQEPERLQVVRPDNLDAPPLPPRGGQPDMNAEELERIRRMKAQQFQEAVQAKSTVQVQAPRSVGSSRPANGPLGPEDTLANIAAARQRLYEQSRSDPNSAFRARLAELRQGGMGTGGGGADGLGDTPFRAAASASREKGFDQFNGADGEDRWALDAKLQAPRSPYELRAGFVIPAMLVSGINSDLPGQIIGQVTQSVYDTATGKHLLVPQGARLVGSYSSDVAYGQARVLVAWQRIVFPDGKAMDIGAMPGADGIGYSGLNDKVNNHYVRVFGSALLMSGVVAGISLSQDRNTNSSFGGGNQRESASSAMSEALGQQLGQVTAQMIAKNLNIAPTLEIRPGFRFNVMVTKDLTFSKPYQAFDY
ncbi:MULTISPECIES: TrbI/VirB10 family protein [unclassified Pseudomonas]|uniref:TrbI/VirB10 family protein n=1 Tax=unclassified Pseudomonas TaxID=196821 RepID=UPI002E297516|nr:MULTISPECIES: TrbI/VirB10 family protein [unclassified Pseudomonas]